MKYVLRIVLMALLFVTAFCTFSFCEELRMDAIVDQFKEATELQRQELKQYYKDREILGCGIVENVRDYSTFDETNDIERRYYEVISTAQKTQKGNNYRVIFLYKDINKVKGFNKGQTIERNASILRIIDDRLWISVWLYEGELTAEEKAQFRYQ